MLVSRRMKAIIFFVLMLFCSCAPNSLADFQKEGEAVCRNLIEELKEIETREDLVKAAPHLRVYFEKLVDLMIGARQYLKDSEEVVDLAEPRSEVSQALAEELRRIYQMESGRDVIEKAQKEALLRLDAFESRHSKS